MLPLAVGSQYIIKQFGELNRKIFLFGTSRGIIDENKNAIVKAPWYIITPTSRFKFFWNFVLLSLLLYTATIVPYRTAFVDVPSL